MDRAGPFRPPLELDLEPFRAPAPGPSIAAGVGLGVVLAAIAAQLWVAYHLEPMALWTDAELGRDVEVGNLSRLAQSPLWRWGLPAATTVGLGVLLACRTRRFAAYALLAVAAVSLLILTYVWAMAPLDVGYGR